ncbi:hypothetical protein ACF0H5_014903 [Mactra antiquata]
MPCMLGGVVRIQQTVNVSAACGTIACSLGRIKCTVMVIDPSECLFTHWITQTLLQTFFSDIIIQFQWFSLPSLLRDNVLNTVKV